MARKLSRCWPISGPHRASRVRPWDTKGSRWRHEAAARLVEKVIVEPARVYAAKWVDQNGKAWRFDTSSVEIVWRDHRSGVIGSGDRLPRVEAVRGSGR